MSKSKWYVMTDMQCLRLNLTGPSPFDAKTLEKSVCVYKWGMFNGMFRLRPSRSPYLSYDTSLSLGMESGLGLSSSLFSITLVDRVNTSSSLS